MSVILFFSEYLIWIEELYDSTLSSRVRSRCIFPFQVERSDSSCATMSSSTRERVGGTAGERTGREAKVHWFDRFDITPSGWILCCCCCVYVCAEPMSAAEELRAETEGEREKRMREPGEWERETTSIIPDPGLRGCQCLWWISFGQHTATQGWREC